MGKLANLCCQNFSAVLIGYFIKLNSSIATAKIFTNALTSAIGKSGYRCTLIIIHTTCYCMMDYFL